MQILLAIVGFIGVIGIIIGFPLGIFFSFKASGEQDLVKKQHIKKQAKWSFLAPILLIILDLFVFMVSHAVQTASQK